MRYLVVLWLASYAVFVPVEARVDEAEGMPVERMGRVDDRDDAGHLIMN